MFYRNDNDNTRQEWLGRVLRSLPEHSRILDAGVGEQRNRQFCSHLDYVSQDFCKYEGSGDGRGHQTGSWDTGQIDLVCDIITIPEPDAAFDSILCTEVLEHIPQPTEVFDEFSRLIRPGSKLILTAPFLSLVHMAPHHYCSGFSRYWYEHHLPVRGFCIEELVPNGDWFSFCGQELMRLGSTARACGDWSWPLAYVIGGLGALHFRIRGGARADDLACFGWHCLAVRESTDSDHKRG
ncbi:MAG: hypothetical protein FD165_710 [Gammaproteobacteria bacterium]|nr:MAG: hypothetical protein FD165_710 [Gammaproteobacteria bacterium]TND07037.1 MAG: hypothetical protein FD120_205 [Gammaproteobacteria bacterium]